MRISVIGATGMAGGPIVAEALTRGHTVTAFSRTPPTSLPQHARLIAGSVDVSTVSTLAPAFVAADAVVLAVRPNNGHEHQLAHWTSQVLDVAAGAGTHVLIIGGAGPLTSPGSPDQLIADNDTYVPTRWRHIALASVDQLRACRRHPHTGWTYLSPAASFEPGSDTGSYRRGGTTLLVDADGVSKITPADLALAAIDELETPNGESHFTVAQTLSSTPHQAETPRSLR